MECRRWQIVRAMTAALVAAGCAVNQAGLPEPGSPVQPERECSNIDQLLGPALPEPAAARPLKRVHACRDIAGAAIANELRRLSGSRDTSALQRAAWLVQYLHDAQVYSAALDIAGDSASSPEARVTALWVLAMTLRPSENRALATFFHEPEPEQRALYVGCTCTGHYYYGYTTDSLTWPAVSRLVPADFVGQIETLVERLEASPSEPLPVRWAAERVRRMTPERELLELLATQRTRDGVSRAGHTRSDDRPRYYATAAGRRLLRHR